MQETSRKRQGSVKETSTLKTARVLSFEAVPVVDQSGAVDLLRHTKVEALDLEQPDLPWLDDQKTSLLFLNSG